MKTTLSKVSQHFCCGKLCLKENVDKKVMSKTPSQELYIRFSKRNNAAEG